MCSKNHYSLRFKKFLVSSFICNNKKKVVFESNTNRLLDFNRMSDRLTGIIKSMWSEEEHLKINKKMKDGIKNYKEKHGRWGRKRVFGETLGGSSLSENQFWNRYKQYREAKISKSGIARILGMSRQTLYKRLKENSNKYQEIEKPN